MDQDTNMTAVSYKVAQLQIESSPWAVPNPPIIQQSSVFSMLPSELIIEVFSYLDIVTVFEFMDTCRYHRYLLLNLPEVWRKVRFIPLSEYALFQNSSTSSSTTLSSAAAAAANNNNTNNNNTSSTETAVAAAEVSKPSHRLKHAENERDRERGGSRSLISEIYAVLRRFRKENGLINYVREIFMDSTDSPHFPSPLVMLIKFPHLQVLSSRYRRGQTSLNTDTHTLKDMLRNGEVRAHGLALRRWDIFNPYMTVEDVAGFKTILDAISKVGQELEGQGVVLDIKTCPGPIEGSVEAATAGTGSQGRAARPTTGMHWATPTQQTPPAPAPATGSAPAQSPSTPKIPKCDNVVWKLEKCRICLAPQDRCYKCVKLCNACGAVRAPPYINHQTQLERERAGRTATTTASTTAAGAGSATTGAFGRPVTPPGSISLSQLSNPNVVVPSAYLSLRGASLASLTSALVASSSPPTAAPLMALPVPPEFSFFD